MFRTLIYPSSGPCDRVVELPQSQAREDGYINRLTLNDPYMGRTAPLTSKCCILYIYSTNIGT